MQRTVSVQLSLLRNKAFDQFPNDDWLIVMKVMPGARDVKKLYSRHHIRSPFQFSWDRIQGAMN